MGLTDLPRLACHEHKVRLRLTLIDSKIVPELILCVTPVLLQTCLKIEHPLRPTVHIFMLAFEDKFMFPRIFSS